jgi:hypothetical protein
MSVCPNKKLKNEERKHVHSKRKKNDEMMNKWSENYFHLPT